MDKLLAHSARYGCPVQDYEEHIRNVVKGAFHRARIMLRHYSPTNDNSPNVRELLAIMGDATSFHDFGKLDKGFQETLRNNCRSPNHIRHEDAGVALLAEYGALEAAGLVSAHHQGLVRYEFERSQPRIGQIPEQKLSAAPFRINDAMTNEATAKRLFQYREYHEHLLGATRSIQEEGLSRCSGFARRILLSCLVDSDHSDTARHYGQDFERAAPTGRWQDRLIALDQYVDGLRMTINKQATDAEKLRQEIRDVLYETCRNADTSIKLRSCDAVVGSGKTTAVMAHLLKVAAEKRLRHIFVVLPYTNIIRQSVEVYRKALCLPGEDPETVVAEHHHQAAFRDLDLRGLTTLWCSPIIVTTAVQFFETLAANHTGKLRKLHELPGSAVFLDEAHAALPSTLWPACWNWLIELVNDWNGYLVLASGSLAEFWRLEEFRSITEGKDSRQRPSQPIAPVTPLSNDQLRTKSRMAEHKRIRFETLKDSITAETLCELIESSPGPRLVIVNTVQSAAVLTKQISERGKQKVLHLSTALAPVHRAITIERIKQLLRHYKDWTLVATSLIEAGMNFSFASGFRQRCSTTSLIQTGGRINREADKMDDCRILDFDFSDTATFPNNPSIESSRRILGELFDSELISVHKPMDLAKICLDALRMEFRSRQQDASLEIVKNENWMDYPLVAEKCRVIQSDTRMVLVDREMVRRLRSRTKIDHQDLIYHSLQLYHSKIVKLGLEPVLSYSDDLFVLPDGWRYDPDCYGYMAGWFDLEALKIPGGYFI